MSDIVQAEFIVESEVDGCDIPVHLTGWEEVVFQLEDEGEWPWS